MLKRSMATLPPGQTIVPCVASANASVIEPALTAGVGTWYALPSAWPREYPSRLPVKSEPSSECRPDATYQVARPLGSYRYEAKKMFRPATSME